MYRSGILLAVVASFFMGCAATTTAPPPETTADLRLELPPYNGKKTTVAVIDLRNQSEFDDPRIGRGVSNMLITALVNSGRFIVVERNDQALEKIFAEQKLGQTGAVTSQTAAQVGKMLGARTVVVGEVSEFGIRKTSAFVGVGGTKTITTRVVIDARLVDSETAGIIAGETGIGTGSTQTKGVALTFEFGTAGFDETTIGIATRKAVNQVVAKFALNAENDRINKKENK